MIPSVAIRDANLQPSDKLVLGAILYFERLKLGYCTASNATLGEIAGCSTATARDCISRLQSQHYIKCSYKDNSKRVRERIESRVSLSSDTLNWVSSNNDTGIVKQRHRVSLNNEQRENIKENRNNTSNEVSLQVSELIKDFEEININAKSWYGNKTQRKALEDLIDTVGFERIKKIISILPKTNKLRYVTTITTPYQLLTKFSDLETQLSKLKEEKSKKIIL